MRDMDLYEAVADPVAFDRFLRERRRRNRARSIYLMVGGFLLGCLPNVLLVLGHRWWGW